MWLLFAFSASLLASFNPIVLKRVLRTASPLATTWAVASLSLPLIAGLTLALTPSMPRLTVVFAPTLIAAGALNTAAHLAFAYALRRGEVSLVAPLLSFSPAFTLLFALAFLGEVPSLRGSLGVAMVLLGAYGLTREPDRPWHAPITGLLRNPSFLLVVLAGLLWAITPLLEKTAIQNTAPESPQLVAFGSTVLLAAFLTPAMWTSGREAVRPLWNRRLDVLLAGLIGGAAPILGFTAMATGLLGYVTAIFKLGSALSIVWASLLLGERHLARRLPLALLMAAGTILIAI